MPDEVHVLLVEFVPALPADSEATDVAAAAADHGSRRRLRFCLRHGCRRGLRRHTADGTSATPGPSRGAAPSEGEGGGRDLASACRVRPYIAKVARGAAAALLSIRQRNRPDGFARRPVRSLATVAAAAAAAAAHARPSCDWHGVRIMHGDWAAEHQLWNLRVEAAAREMHRHPQSVRGSAVLPRGKDGTVRIIRRANLEARSCRMCPSIWSPEKSRSSSSRPSRARLKKRSPCTMCRMSATRSTYSSRLM